MAITSVDDKEAASRDRVAFVLYGYGLGNSPSLINAANMLARTGYVVDIFTCGTFLGNVSFDRADIRIHDIRNHGKVVLAPGIITRAYRRISNLLKRLFPRSFQVTTMQHSVEKLVASYVDHIESIIQETPYKYFVGVEPLGMMAAHLLGVPRKTPFIYYNMELHYGPDITTIPEFVSKEIEKKYNKFASFTITLDSKRAKFISDENGVPGDSIVTVPVCAEGEPFRGKTSYLRDKFGLGKDVKIVLYAGFIADWAMCEEMALSAQSWPENRVLVLHSHGYHDDGYIKKIKRLEGKKVRLSTTPVSYEELPAFLASADIGIALYKNLGANFTLISSASGKIAHYLKSGLPLVVNSYPDISGIVERYSCGRGIDNPSQINAAVDTILGNYERMRSGAFLCYEENYMFSRQFAKVIRRLGRH